MFTLNIVLFQCLKKKCIWVKAQVSCENVWYGYTNDDRLEEFSNSR